MATSVFTPGKNRVAFGVIDDQSGFVYGKTALYVAPTPDSKALGPFPRPPTCSSPQGRYRSKQAATEADPFAAVYAAQVPFKPPGVRHDRPQSGFVYGKTALYVARTPGSKALGPFPAPADVLITQGRYRSKQAATESDPFAAVYAAQVPFEGRRLLDPGGDQGRVADLRRPGPGQGGDQGGGPHPRRG